MAECLLFIKLFNKFVDEINLIFGCFTRSMISSAAADKANIASDDNLSLYSLSSFPAAFLTGFGNKTRADSIVIIDNVFPQEISH